MPRHPGLALRLCERSRRTLLGAGQIVLPPLVPLRCAERQARTGAREAVGRAHPGRIAAEADPPDLRTAGDQVLVVREVRERDGQDELLQEPARADVGLAAHRRDFRARQVNQTERRRPERLCADDRRRVVRRPLLVNHEFERHGAEGVEGASGDGLQRPRRQVDELLDAVAALERAASIIVAQRPEARPEPAGRDLRARERRLGKRGQVRQDQVARKRRPAEGADAE